MSEKSFKYVALISLFAVALRDPPLPGFAGAQCRAAAAQFPVNPKPAPALSHLPPVASSPEVLPPFPKTEH